MPREDTDRLAGDGVPDPRRAVWIPEVDNDRVVVGRGMLEGIQQLCGVDRWVGGTGHDEQRSAEQSSQVAGRSARGRPLPARPRRPSDTTRACRVEDRPDRLCSAASRQRGRHTPTARDLQCIVVAVFVSYRREDSAGWAGRIHDALEGHFGDHQLFMDVADISLGEDFRDVVRRRLSTVETVIVVIGPQWLAVENANGDRRIDDPRDVVRLEVAAALQSPATVIPVLVDGASMPGPAELPAELALLSFTNALEIDPAGFSDDMHGWSEPPIRT